MSNPAQNWRGKCGRGPSLEHPVDGYCLGCATVEALETSLAEAREQLRLAKMVCANVQAGRDSAREMCGKLVEALKMLHDETEDYIKINHLGDPHHNQSMKLSKEALSLFEEWEKKR